MAAARVFAPPFWSLAVLLAFFLLLSGALLHKKSSAVFFAFAAAFFLFGALRFVAADTLPANDVSHFADKDAKIFGTIREIDALEDAEDGARVRYLVSAERIEFGATNAKISGGLYVYDRADKKARIGDAISARGTIRLPVAYNNPGRIDTVMQLKVRGITARLGAGQSGVEIAPRDGFFFARFTAGIRAHYLAAMRSAMGVGDAHAVFAMLFGGYEGVKEEMLAAFSATGIIHLLSVSGTHVSMLAAAVACLAAFLRLPKTAACVAVVSVVIVYAALAGFSPPVVRAACMGSLAFLASAAGREGDAKRIFALTAVVMLVVSPLILFDVSFQLSFAATAGILYIAPVFFARRGPLPRFAALALSVTLAVQIFALPILAHYFHRVSLIAFLANIIVVPFAETVIIAGLLAGIVAAVLPLAGKIAFALDSLVLGFVYELSRMLAHVPSASVYAPSFGAAGGAMYYAALIFLLQEKDVRQKFLAFFLRRKNIFFVSAAAVLFFFAAYRFSRPDEIAVHFIDVRQGSAALVTTPHGRAFMIDSGGVREGGFDVGARVDVPYLLHYGVTKLDCIFLTHAHEDHAAGAGGIMRELPVARVVTAGEPREEYARGMGFSVNAPEMQKLLPAKEGMRFDIDGVAVDVLYAPQEVGAGNEWSNVYRVTYKNAVFLFTGDLIKEHEAIFLAEGKDAKCTVLQVAHHGSATSSSAEFVQAARPAWAVFCVGKYNSFGHPKEEVVERFRAAGAKILRTDENGAVVFHTDGKKIRVETFLKK